MKHFGLEFSLLVTALTKRPNRRGGWDILFIYSDEIVFMVVLLDLGFAD